MKPDPINDIFIAIKINCPVLNFLSAFLKIKGGNKSKIFESLGRNCCCIHKGWMDSLNVLFKCDLYIVSKVGS